MKYSGNGFLFEIKMCAGVSNRVRVQKILKREFDTQKILKREYDTVTYTLLTDNFGNFNTISLINSSLTVQFFAKDSFCIE